MGHWINALKNRDMKKASNIPYLLFSRIIQNQGFETQGIEGCPPGPELKMDTFNKMKLGHLFQEGAERKRASPQALKEKKRKASKPSSPRPKRTFRNLDTELAAEVAVKNEPQDDVIGASFRVGSSADPSVNPDSVFAQPPSQPQPQPETQPIQPPQPHHIRIKRPKNYKPSVHPSSQTHTETQTQPPPEHQPTQSSPTKAIKPQKLPTRRPRLILPESSDEDISSPITVPFISSAADLASEPPSSPSHSLSPPIPRRRRTKTRAPKKFQKQDEFDTLMAKGAEMEASQKAAHDRQEAVEARLASICVDLAEAT